MKRNVVIQIALPVATALFVGGCSTSSQKAATYSHEAQGAPVVEQKTEVMTASGGIESTNQADLQLHKEEMVVEKRQVSNGGVLVRTLVQTENVSQPVELQREEYVIERIPASQVAAGATETAFVAREIYIPLTREEPLASKRTLLSEKVQLGKRIETDRKTVSTPIRSEDVQVTKVSGKPPGNVWQETAPVTPSAHEANALNLLHEEMVVGKTVVDNGGVKLQKVVHSQVVSQPVELKREEFALDRSAVTAPQVTDADFSQKEIRLNLSREEPVVGTRIEPTEWVRVRKQVHTDTQTVTGTVRKENIEIVKLAADQAAMGGTSASSQSGTTVTSGSGAPGQVRASVLADSPTPPFITLRGKALCAKCQLHQAGICQTVIQVQDGDKSLDYYLVQNNVSRNFHEDVCHAAKQVTVTGSASEVEGKLFFIPNKIALVH
jgi:uncharacterized protein (TIGR02271 family)